VDRPDNPAHIGPERRAITVAELLEEAREGLARLSPQEAHEAALDGATLVDIRSEEQRLEDGKIACATSIPRNVLEWRLDPACPHRDPRLARRDQVVIVLCDEGYQSSPAAATLRRFGLDAADVVGVSGLADRRTAGGALSALRPPREHGIGASNGASRRR
jgi:rhodanese-related sulfurtransferase